MVRIFVRGISRDITNSDINCLFSKLYTVEEVYIPPSTITGVHRNFAIVLLKIEDKDEIRKCIQTLNGSLWKGNKLRLELANEWYIDRLDKERIQLLQDLNPKIDVIDELVLAPSLPAISNDSIHLRHNSKEYYISMKPNILMRNQKHLSTINKTNSIISCGCKRLFSNDIEQYGYTSNEEVSDTEGNSSKSIKLEKEPDRMKSLNKISNMDNDVINNNKSILAGKTTNAIGGGVRRGFGNLSITKDIPISNVDCCIETQDQVIKNNNKNNIRKLHIEEIDSSEDDEPCLKLEDISDEALQKERERAISLFNNFFNDKNNEKKDLETKQVHINKELENIDIKNDTVIPTINNNDDILVTKDGYANINQLKNIFYREGGVWWGDDGTLKDAVGKGDIALDPMFLEAEKHGIDIRKYSTNNTTTNITNMNNSYNNSNSIVNDANDVIDDKNAPMLFSFFDSSPDNADDQSQYHLNPFLSNNNNNNNNNITNYNNESNNILTNIKSKGTTKETMIIHDNNQNQNIEVLVNITSKELISIAKKFTRVNTINEVTEQWKTERERHILDYKRKTRDMKRRTAAWNNKVSLTNHHIESNSNKDNNIKNNKTFMNTIHYNRNRKKSSNKYQKNHT